MSKLSEFFTETHTTLGVFFPLHCIVAVFPDLIKARHVNRDLVFTGFPADQVAAFDGKEFLELEKKESGFWEHLMQAFSQSLGAEQLSTKHHLEFAENGAAFLIVHCPTEEIKAKAWAKLQTEDPLAVHYYSTGHVEHMKCTFSTTY